MQGPIGLRGVQDSLKSSHSEGYILPTMTKWQEHPGGISCGFPILISNFLSASNSSYLSRIAKPPSSIRPIPLQGLDTDWKTSAMISWAILFPSGFTTLEYSLTFRTFYFWFAGEALKYPIIHR